MYCYTLPSMKMQQLVASFVVYVLVFVSKIDIVQCSHGSSSSIVSKYCSQGLDFQSTTEFDQFIQEFKLKSEDQLKKEPSIGNCLRDRILILELEPLIQRQNVCEFSKIEDLVDYHKKYLKSSSRYSSRSSRPITEKFFTKYAIQVAHACKKNLLGNLEIAKQELGDRSKVFEEARDRVYRDEPSIKSNIKLIEEQSDCPPATNVRPQDEAELTLSEYREALTRLRRPEDILTFDRDDCLKSRRRETTISKNKMAIFFKPALICLELSRYYGASVLSIAKLANYGYVAVDEELDVKLADSRLVRDWTIAVQVCDPLLFMSTSKIDGDWATVDTCAERVTSIEMMVFEDHLVELDKDLLEDMMAKSEATRSGAQKIMKSAMKSMAKARIMQQLSSGVKKRSIFSESLAVFNKPLDASKLGGGGFSSPTSARETVLSDSVEKSLGGMMSVSVQKKEELSDKESYELLMKATSGDMNKSRDPDSKDGAVRMFDPISSLVSGLTVIAIMLSFEWLFFIVMTLAARVCHSLNFEFDNLLTFPPKILSWSDADFATLNDKLEKLDEDDLFDYDELNPDEQQQRDLLAKVFGRTPPMLFRD